MLVERLEIRLLDLPLVEPFIASHGTTTSRQIVVVRIETDRGHGWGECSALPEPTYTEEFAAGAFMVLEDELAPRLVGHSLAPEQVRSRLSVVGGNPMAKAALEMALLDAELRYRNISLAAWLGVTRSAVKAGAAVGIASPDAVARRVAALADEGFARVKIKIKPGHDQEVIGAVQAAAAGVELQVDGNGAYRADDHDHLVRLATSGVTTIEQPFAPGDTEAAARLVAASQVPIVADEAASSTSTVQRLERAGVLSGVSVKPPRLGGILAARDLHDRGRETELAMTAGGMLETGLGRGALAAVAALDGFTITGDVSPAGRWLAVDPWPDLVMAGDEIQVPSGPGIAPNPDLDHLEAQTLQHTELRFRRFR